VDVDRLLRRSRHIGLGREAAGALRELIARLGTDPRTLGEPLFQLPRARLTVRVAVVLPVAVDYAVHDDARFVVVRRVAGLGRLAGPAG
jgi:hypothetical protein